MRIMWGRGWLRLIVVIVGVSSGVRVAGCCQRTIEARRNCYEFESLIELP